MNDRLPIIQGDNIEINQIFISNVVRAIVHVLVRQCKFMDIGTKVNAWERKVPFDVWKSEILREV